MTNDTIDKLPPAQTFAEAAERWRCARSTIRRAHSHGMFRVVYVGNRPIIPPKEVARIDEQGLPHIPAGYRRLTTGPTKLGRPKRSAPPTKAAPTRKTPRRRRSPELRPSA